MRLSALENRHVAILGFGAEGQAAYRLLKSRLKRCNVTIIEENSDHAAAQRFPADPATTLLTGPLHGHDLTRFDVVIKSPGISPYRPEIRRAMAQGTRFTSGTQLWCDEHPQARLIVVTGTKGKSTTASLIAHLLNRAGRRTELIGNIGKPALEAWSPDPKPEFWVMELSSYQATGLRCHAEVALLLNLYPEHTDWHGSTERYYRDKTQFMLAPGVRTIILEHDGQNLPRPIAGSHKRVHYNDPNGIHVREDGIYLGQRRVVDATGLPLPGAHNLLNGCAALTVIDRLGIDIETVLPAMKDFRGLAHRLASLGFRNGVEYIDDSISTTPQSALAALKSFPDRPCTLLLGGYDRDLDWHDFARASRNTTLHRVVTLPENGERIAAALAKEHPTLPVIKADGMADAVAHAARATPPGGTIILSPGAPSYGNYRDFRERGKDFARCAGLWENEDRPPAKE